MTNGQVRPLLQRQRIFTSRNPEEACAFLRGKEFRFDISRREAKHLDLHINGIYLPSLYVGYIQYGSPAEVRTNPARDDYWLQLPFMEQMEFTIGGERLLCGPERGAVSSPARGLRIRTKRTGARLNISLTASALTRQLTALLGTTPAAPIEFAPCMDLTTGYGRSLAQQVRLAVAEFERAGAMRWDAMTTSLFEQFVLNRLLLSHPNNYSELLRVRDRSLSPRELRRALDYIRANLAAPITIADIAQASGIAGRTLFQHFHEFLGTSPMRYLRDARFEKVRGALQRARPGESVTLIATRWGFSHFGRFAVEYRNRFGESPSSTMRRRQGPADRSC